MVLIAGVLVVILFFIAVSIFDPKLRDKIVEGLQDITNKIFTEAPPALDKIVTNPLKNQLQKLKAGRTEGGLATVD